MQHVAPCVNNTYLKFHKILPTFKKDRRSNIDFLNFLRPEFKRPEVQYLRFGAIEKNLKDLIA